MNDWKETVRTIYDMMHTDKALFSPDEKVSRLARNIIEVIEERHHGYFCEEVKK